MSILLSYCHTIATFYIHRRSDDGDVFVVVAAVDDIVIDALYNFIYTLYICYSLVCCLLFERPRENVARKRDSLSFSSGYTCRWRIFSLNIKWVDMAVCNRHTLNYCNIKYKLLTLIAFFRILNTHTILFIVRLLCREFTIFESITVVMRLPTHLQEKQIKSQTTMEQYKTRTAMMTKTTTTTSKRPKIAHDIAFYEFRGG